MTGNLTSISARQNSEVWRERHSSMKSRKMKKIVLLYLCTSKCFPTQKDFVLVLICKMTSDEIEVHFTVVQVTMVSVKDSTTTTKK